MHTLIKSSEFISNLFAECKMSGSEELLIDGKRYRAGILKEGMLLAVVGGDLVGRRNYTKTSKFNRRKLGLISFLNKKVKEIETQLANSHMTRPIKIGYVIKDVGNDTEVTFQLDCTLCCTRIDGEPWLAINDTYTMLAVSDEFCETLKATYLNY